MTMVIPVAAVPRQTLSVTLNSQACNINIYQTTHGVFCDLFVGSTMIIGGVLCRNNVLIVQSAYLGFVGDLAFVDTQGATDPQFAGFGTRYIFVYYFPSDLSA